MNRFCNLLNIILFVILLMFHNNVHAELIDFEGLELSDGDLVPDIGVAQFEAHVAKQGGGSFAFISSSGSDTGNSAPFNASGNTFITNIGGLGSGDFVKTIIVNFSVPVTDLSFSACDVDRAVAIEVLTAKIFDSDGSLLAEEESIAPTVGSGDGDVILIDFGDIGGIRKLEVSLGSQGKYSAIGFGIDDLAFTPDPCEAAYQEGYYDGLMVEEITICHKPETINETKTIPRSALMEHLGHGDTIGECN
jgi:hypothetical protein